jgi:hypothetical protein
VWRGINVFNKVLKIEFPSTATGFIINLKVSHWQRGLLWGLKCYGNVRNFLEDYNGPDARHKVTICNFSIERQFCVWKRSCSTCEYKERVVKSGIPPGVRWNAVASTIKLTLSGVFLFTQGRDENGIVICQQRHTRFIFRIFHPRGWNRDIPCLYRIEKVMTPAGNVACQILCAYCRRNSP